LGTSDWNGGGIYSDESSLTVANCVFYGNSARRGGGIYNDEGSVSAINCLFFGNSASDMAGGIYCGFGSSSAAIITNCTFFGNSAGNSFGGIRCGEGSYTVTNSILWGNTSELFNLHSQQISGCTVTHSNIDQDGYEGSNGNIREDPLFVDPDSGNLRLDGSSPCIDAGTNSASGIQATDYEGDARIIDGDQDGTATVDMGADEYIQKGKAMPWIPLLLFDDDAGSTHSTSISFSGTWEETDGDYGTFTMSFTQTNTTFSGTYDVVKLSNEGGSDSYNISGTRNGNDYQGMDSRNRELTFILDNGGNLISGSYYDPSGGETGTLTAQ
jgi:hypothetical protein